MKAALKYICLLLIPLLIGCQDIVLTNDEIDVHLSEAGGSISYVSEHGAQNIINNRDMGRQIQQSFYAGELQVHPDQHHAWSPWPWNIVQSGDVYGHTANMIPLFISKTRAVVLSTPMLWDRNNKKEHCATLINDVTLIDNKIRVHVSLVLSHECEISNPKPHHQEMPAVYTVGNLDHLLSGDQKIENDTDFIWSYWIEEEKWAGAFDSAMNGIAVYMEDVELFIGGRYENGRDKTTYFAPLRTIELKPGDTLNYTYWIIVGDLLNIQSCVATALEAK